ncbi:MAG: SAM-dependent methyltransferase [Pseudomonadota bacterium]
MELQNVVPWGRSFIEYQQMFSLSETDLQKRILGCGDGPSSFNAEVTELGGHVISIDPIYQFSSEQIHSRIEHVYPKIMEQVSKNRDDYVWNAISNPEQLGRVRMNAMNTFLTDYKNHQASRRYINGQLPTLPFVDAEFDLALCSHYLFLYSKHVSQEQHVLSVKELCRVAKEVRIYPLLSIENNVESPHLRPVVDALEAVGVNASLVSVDYEFQKGATKMLVAKSV